MEPIGLWNKLAKVVGEVDCVLHMGDQIYGDMDRIAKYVIVIQYYALMNRVRICHEYWS